MPRGGRRQGAGRPKGRGNSLPVVGFGIAMNTVRIAQRRLEDDPLASAEDHVNLGTLCAAAQKVLNDVSSGTMAPDAGTVVLRSIQFLVDMAVKPRVQKVEVKDERAHSRLAFAVADRVLGPAVPVHDPLTAIAAGEPN